jgi:hypothetical protein
MNLYKKVFYLGLGVLFLSSCIKDGLCHTEGKIEIEIEDKNYYNIYDIKGIAPINEDLPMYRYTNQVFLWWNNSNDLSINYIANAAIEKSELSHKLNAAHFEEGMNQVVSVGNGIISDLSSESDFMYELHPNNIEENDVYIGYSDIPIPLYEDVAIKMFRAKGKLLTYINNLPTSVARVEINIGGVYKTVDKKLNYSGSTHVTKSVDATMNTTDGRLTTECFVSPNVDETGAHLTINLYNKGGNITSLYNIYLKIDRNRITVVNLNYNSEMRSWELSMLVDGHWEQVHNLIVSE